MRCHHFLQALIRCMWVAAGSEARFPSGWRQRSGCWQDGRRSEGFAARRFVSRGLMDSSCSHTDGLKKAVMILVILRTTTITTQYLFPCILTTLLAILSRMSFSHDLNYFITVPLLLSLVSIMFHLQAAACLLCEVHEHKWFLHFLGCIFILNALMVRGLVQSGTKGFVQKP